MERPSYQQKSRTTPQQNHIFPHSKVDRDGSLHTVQIHERNKCD